MHNLFTIYNSKLNLKCGVELSSGEGVGTSKPIVTESASHQLCHHNIILNPRVLGSSPSDEDLELKVRFATLLRASEKYLIKIECADLENEAKTTCEFTNLSFSFFVCN